LRGLLDEGLVTAEFDLYRSCHNEDNPAGGKGSRGFLRNMYVSCLQQALHQDPLYYALVACMRSDLCHTLLVHPYIAKYASKGQHTGFLHIDVNPRGLVENGEGLATVQTAFSFDEETNDGCTLIFEGTHKYTEAAIRGFHRSSIREDNGDRV